MKYLTKVLLTIVLYSAGFQAIGQNWTTDSVIWGNKIFISKIPKDYKRNIDNYTEGIFINYVFPDTSVFAIFYGSNAKLTLYQQEKFDTISVSSNIYFGTNGSTEKYWKAKKITEGFIYWYNQVTEERLETFDQIFNSFEIKAIKDGG